MKALEHALGQLMGFRTAVMDKNLQRLAAQKRGPATAPDVQTTEGQQAEPSSEDLARLLEQYGRGD